MINFSQSKNRPAFQWKFLYISSHNENSSPVCSPFTDQLLRLYLKKIWHASPIKHAMMHVHQFLYFQNEIVAHERYVCISCMISRSPDDGRTGAKQKSAAANVTLHCCLTPTPSTKFSRNCASITKRCRTNSRPQVNNSVGSTLQTMERQQSQSSGMSEWNKGTTTMTMKDRTKRNE